MSCPSLYILEYHDQIQLHNKHDNHNNATFVITLIVTTDRYQLVMYPTAKCEVL
jgi:hypothetical protein